LPLEEFEAFDEAGKAAYEGRQRTFWSIWDGSGVLSMELIRGKPAMALQMKVDPNRVYLSGVTNPDVAFSSTAAMSGLPVSTYRDGDKHCVTLLVVPALYSMFVLDVTFYLRRFS
jgi:hypothetical protein